jgi:hypothetical protein
MAAVGMVYSSIKEHGAVVWQQRILRYHETQIAPAARNASARDAEAGE